MSNFSSLMRRRCREAIASSTESAKHDNSLANSAIYDASSAKPARTFGLPKFQSGFLRPIFLWKVPDCENADPSTMQFHPSWTRANIAINLRNRNCARKLRDLKGWNPLHTHSGEMVNGLSVESLAVLVAQLDLWRTNVIQKLLIIHLCLQARYRERY